MSGHSKWATTHRQKSAADAKKGAAFTKIANLITIAAKQGGGDLEANFALRLAYDKARAANMPKDNIDRAIRHGTGEGGEGKNFEEVTYEIFGPAGSVFIIEAITDNKNRTVSDLKALLNRHDGQFGALNSVAWMFDRKGVIAIETSQLAGKDLDELELAIIDAGADDIAKDDEIWEITTVPDQLNAVLTAIKGMSLETKESGLQYLSKNDVNISDSEDQRKVENLYNLLDDIDDVNSVYTNANW
jgi:YebC/PmpR family DNA-binding regulatory protein